MILSTALLFLCLASGAPGGVTEFSLPNGIRVIDRQVGGSPVEGLAVFLLGGTRALTPQTQGLESFAMECAMMGSEDVPGDAWRRMMDSTSARLTGVYAYDFSCCRLTCLQEDLPVLVDALASCLLRPEMAPSAVTQVRNSLLQGLQRDSYDPDSRVWLVANRGLLPGHPYSLRPDGTPETMATFDPSEAADFLSRRMRGGNILIVHSGPTSDEDLERILARSFGQVPPGADDFLPVPAFPISRDTVVLEVEDILTSYAVAKFPGPRPDSPDFPVFRAGLDVLSDMLFQSLRTESALTYATYSGASLNMRNWGFLYATSSHPVAACSLMAATFEGMLEEPPDSELVRGTLETSRTAFTMQMAAHDAQAYLMGLYEIATGDWRNAWLYSDIAARCSPGDITRVLRMYSGPVAWGLVADSSAVGHGPWPLSREE